MNFKLGGGDQKIAKTAKAEKGKNKELAMTAENSRKEGISRQSQGNVSLIG